jgi:hypothetical protein
MHSAFAILLAAMCFATPVAAQESDGEVVIGDLVDFGFTVAVYVDASRHLRAEMQKAVAHAVNSGILKCARSNCSWAAQPDRIRYCSGISGAGASVRSGLACPKDWGVPKQRFYRVDALERTVGCLELSWDEDHGEYDVFEPQDGA